MNCPVCHIELNNYQASSIELDICNKCEGVWFDRGEFQHIVDSLLSTGAVQEQPIKKALRIKVSPIDESKRRILLCPRCNKQLDLKNFSFDSNVFIDKCSSCHGLWTDKGELLEIAEYMKGNKDLKRYAFAIAEAYKSNDIWFIKFIKDWHCLIACFIGAIYIMIAYLKGGSQSAWYLTIRSLPLPLVLILLGDAAGQIKGSIWLRPAIFRITPGYIVKLLGWTILLLEMLRLFYLL